MSTEDTSRHTASTGTPAIAAAGGPNLSATDESQLVPAVDSQSPSHGSSAASIASAGGSGASSPATSPSSPATTASAGTDGSDAPTEPHLSGTEDGTELVRMPPRGPPPPPPPPSPVG